MNRYDCLFIGGPADGQFRVLADVPDRYRVPFLPKGLSPRPARTEQESEAAMQTPYEIAEYIRKTPPSAAVSYCNYIYVHTDNENDNIFELLVRGAQHQRETIYNLINNYRKISTDAEWRG